MDLVSGTVDALNRAGASQDRIEDFSSYVNEKEPIVGERAAANSYWSLQLLKAHGGTNPQSCLVNDGSNEEWLDLFVTEVLPAVGISGITKMTQGADNE